MATLGSLVVKVGADIAKFQTDMGRASKIASKRSAEMKKHIAGAAKAIAAGAAVAGAAITKMVNDSLKDADRFQKLSIAIGASTEALSELEFAAQQSGADFEAVAKGMGKLQKSIGDANNGLATQKRAFDKLGISTMELMKLTPEKQFEVMGDALQDVSNATERTAIAADIFGQRISVGLMPLLLQGSEGMQGLRAEAAKLGLTLTREAADGAAAFNDKMNTLKMFMTGFGRQITTTLLPTLTKLFDNLVSLGDASEFAAETGRFLANMLKTLASAGIILKNIFEAASKIIVAFGVITVQTFKALISPITSFVNRVGQAFEHLSKGRFKQAASAMGNITSDIVNQFDRAGREIANVTQDMIGGAITDLKEGWEGVQAVWDDTAETAETVLKPALQNTIPDAAEETTEALEEVVVTAKKYQGEWPKMAQQTIKASEEIKETVAGSTGVVAVIENSFKRLDNTFQSFWTDLVRNGKISLRGIKDLFLDTIAQMLHAALTQPIVLRIGATMTGGLASGAASASGGSIFGGAGGFAGMVDGFGSLWGGQGGWMGVGENAAGLGGGYLGYRLGGNTNGAAQIGSLAGGLALGYAGGIVGGILGGPVGAIVGKALGSFIGSLVGNLVGGLFGSKPRIKAGAAGYFTGGGGLNDTRFFDSAFGGVYVGKTKGGLDEHVQDFGDALKQMDDALAGFMTNNQIEKVTQALSNWGMTLKGDAISIEDMLNSRFSVILSTFGQNVQDYVNQFQGLEAQTEALGRFVTALNTVGATIANFVASDPATALADQLEDASKTSTMRLQDISNALVDLFAGFDGTPEMLDQISQAIDARYRGEMEYLQAVDQLVKGISASIEQQQQSIRETIEGPRSFTELMGEATLLLQGISSAGSPEELAQIVSQIQALVGKAFGGLDQAAQVAQAETLISFLDTVQRSAEEQAAALAQMVVDEGVVLREQAQMFAESIGAPLDMNVQATDAVNDSVNRQTDIIIRGNESRDELLEELLREIRLGNSLADLRG